MNRIIFRLGTKYYVVNEDKYFRSLTDAKEHIRILNVRHGSRQTNIAWFVRCHSKVGYYGAAKDKMSF